MENITYTEEKHAVETIGGGSVVEGIGGAGALVLSILGLIGLMPLMMASVATIAAGGALLVGGGTLASRYMRILARTQEGYTRDIIGGGMAMESLCGVAGIVLGILSLLNIMPLTLLPVSAIILGAALLMASGAMGRLAAMPIIGGGGQSHTVARDVLYAASGSEVLVGAGAVVLGILALSGVAPLTLSLVAMLGIGTSVLLAGSSIAGRVFGSFALR